MGTERPLVAGYHKLIPHTAPGVLVQAATVDHAVATALREAETVELVRPFHGAVVHGDMSGDLGAVYLDTPRPDLTAVTLAAVMSAAGKRVLVQDCNASQLPYVPARADVRLLKVQLATWAEDLVFARELAEREPATPVFLYGSTVAHLPEGARASAVRGDAPVAVASLFDVENVHIGAAYELFPLPLYRNDRGEIRVHLQASRGCDRTCRYCPYIRTLGRWSGRDPAALESDVARLSEAGVREVQFRDQDFASDPEHAIEVAGAMARGGGGRVGWSVEGNLDRFTPPVLAAMAAGGATEVIVGIESVDPSVLRQARRRVPRDLAEMIGSVRAAGLRVRGLFMVGLPGDSWASLLATVTLAIELDLDAAQFNTYTPLPGERFGNAETATVHDFIRLTNDFRHRTCDQLSQREVRLARAWATAAFQAHRTGDAAACGDFLRRIEQRVRRQS